MDIRQRMLFAEEGARLRHAGSSYDDILCEFRHRGCSLIVSIAILHQMGLRLSDAKQLVSQSSVWADTPQILDEL